MVGMRRYNQTYKYLIKNLTKDVGQHRIDMSKFKKYLTERRGGAKAGHLEISTISLDDAIEYSVKRFELYGRELYKELPNFNKNFLLAQRQSRKGHTLRKDMPVIELRNIKDLQMRLKNGYIDIHKPFGVHTDPKNPFPEGLSGKDAEKFLNGGLWRNDGNSGDDKVDTKIKHLAVGDLKPIQEQIYFDNVMGAIANNGREGSLKFLSSGMFIVSSDNYILDGHHRYLSGVLIDPSIRVKCLVIDLPLDILLPLTLAYSDAVGNIRNR